jgi:CubicO group peptidase (beta-lactamase class C family)
MNLDRRRFLASIPACTLFGSGFDARNLDGEGDEAIAKAIRPIRERDKLPGLTAAVARPGKPLRVAAVGVRKDGSPEVFGDADLVHLGSCTKAMTATMIATLVEEGKLGWRTTLAEVFPEATIDEGYRGVTLTQLLTHRAGLPPNAAWRGLGAEKSTTDQRRELMRRVLGNPPPKKNGDRMVYSNVGYALAGLMAETVAKVPWEDLMRDRVFKPLGMNSAGFGHPGAVGKVDQPWGHARLLSKLFPSQVDNAPALGPAGTVHATMADWAKFACLHVAGARGERTPILKPETFAELHTPAAGEDYAKGWVIADRKWTGGRAIWHNGSNTRWFAAVWVAPKRDVALLAATNEGSAVAQAAVDAAVLAMVGMID